MNNGIDFYIKCTILRVDTDFKGGKFMKAEGQGCVVELLEDRVIIERKGLFNPLKGTKVIYLKNLSGIHFKKNDFLIKGYIQFIFSGSKELKRGNPLELAKDENTILFSKDDETNFIILKNQLEKAIRDLQQPKKEVIVETVKKDNYLDELERLASLKERGFITDEEFQIKKKQILGL